MKYWCIILMSSNFITKSTWQYFCGWRQNSNLLGGFLFSHDWWRAGPGRLVLLPRLLTLKSQPSFVNRLWMPAARARLNNTGRLLDSHGPGWDSQTIIALPGNHHFIHLICHWSLTFISLTIANIIKWVGAGYNIKLPWSHYQNVSQAQTAAGSYRVTVSGIGLLK